MIVVVGPGGWVVRAPGDEIDLPRLGTHVGKEIVLIGRITVPKSSQALHQPELNKVIKVDDALKLLQFELSLGDHQFGQA